MTPFCNLKGLANKEESIYVLLFNFNRLLAVLAELIR